MYFICCVSSGQYFHDKNVMCAGQAHLWLAGVVLDLISGCYSSWNVSPLEISLPVEADLCQV